MALSSSASSSGLVVGLVEKRALLVLTLSPTEVQLDAYADGVVESSSTFPGLALPQARLARTEGSSLVLAAGMDADTAQQLAGIPVPLQGRGDLLIARLEP